MRRRAVVLCSAIVGVVLVQGHRLDAQITAPVIYFVDRADVEVLTALEDPYTGHMVKDRDVFAGIVPATGAMAFGIAGGTYPSDGPDTGYAQAGSGLFRTADTFGYEGNVWIDALPSSAYVAITSSHAVLRSTFRVQGDGVTANLWADNSDGGKLMSMSLYDLTESREIVQINGLEDSLENLALLVSGHTYLLRADFLTMGMGDGDLDFGMYTNAVGIPGR